MNIPISGRTPERSRSRVGMVLEYGLAVAVIGLIGLPAVTSPRLATEIGAAIRRGDSTVQWIVIGLLIGGTLTFLVNRIATSRAKNDGIAGEVFNSISMLRTLEHERAHVLIGLLVGLHPRSVNASEVEFGEVRWATPRGPFKRARYFLGVIAPYWFSPGTPTVVLLALAFPPRQPAWAAIIGLLAGGALVLPVTQFHLKQRELRQFRLVPTLCAVLWLWTAISTLTLTVVFSGRASQVPALYQAGWRQFLAIVGL